MAAWRDYLVGQMHEQYGVAKQEAQKTVARWLRSLGQRPAASEAQPIPEAVRIRNQRPRPVEVYVQDRQHVKLERHVPKEQ